MGRLTGKRALIVGASSEGGIGSRCARRLAGEGAFVIVAARRVEPLRDLAHSIRGEALRCDLSIEAEVAALVGDVAARGGVDLVLNAAGDAVPSTCATATGDAVRSAFGVHFEGLLWLLRQAAALLPNGGSLTTIASVAATQVMPGYMLYGSAKAASLALVRYAALELAPFGIRVNAITPGLVDTPLTAPIRDDPQAAAAIMKELPLRRLIDVGEIADTLLWLHEAPSVTGASIVVDAGLALRRPLHPEDMVG